MLKRLLYHPFSKHTWVKRPTETLTEELQRVYGDYQTYLCIKCKKKISIHPSKMKNKIILKEPQEYSLHSWIDPLDQLPKVNEPVLVILQNNNTNKNIYGILKYAGKQNVIWRTIDKNLELSHNYTVIYWHYLPKIL